MATTLDIKFMQWQKNEQKKKRHKSYIIYLKHCVYIGLEVDLEGYHNAGVKNKVTMVLCVNLYLILEFSR